MKSQHRIPKNELIPWSRTKGIRRLFIMGLWLFATVSAYGQISKLSQAQELATTGQYEAAATLYDQLLAEQSDDLQVQLGRAYNYSWNGRYAEARRAFSQILKQNPAEAEALTGLAYTLAWEGKYAESEALFLHLKSQQPNSEEANKGLAYLALWQKQPREAVRKFEALTALYPENEELRISLAQAYLIAGRHIAARSALMEVIELDENNQSALSILTALPETPAWMEFDFWAGMTRLVGESKWGLRGARIAWRPELHSQVWLRYDNALTLDNHALLRNNQGISAVFAGGLHSWNDQWTSRFEVGRRVLLDDVRQLFFQGEQVHYLKSGHALRLGGFYGPRSDGSHESMIYAGGVIAAWDRISIEPTYFYAVDAVSKTNDQRFLLAGTYRLPNSMELNAGFQYGRVSAELPLRSLYGGHLIGRIPVGLHWVHALFRYESAQGTSRLVTAAGIRFRLER